MKKRYKYLSWSSVLLFALFCACVYIDSYEINQPQPDGTQAPKVEIGKVATFILKGNVASIQDSEEDSRFIVAMLAPRSWDIANNTVITFSGGGFYDPLDVQTMSVIPAGTAPYAYPGYTWPDALRMKYGIGGNKYNDMEWVAWWADSPKPYSNGSKGQYTVTIKSTVSEENLVAYLGFFVSHSARGFADDISTPHYTAVFPSELFTVYGGPDETIDFTKTRFNMIEPTRALQDDLISFTFAGETNVNDLINYDEIYFESTAYTAEGGVYTVNKRDRETLMTRPNTFEHNYSVVIWPAGFYSIPDGETITRIEYCFTNREGTVVVNKAYDMKINGDTPENDDIPFTYYLRCGV